MIQQAKIPIPILKSQCNIENPQVLLCINSQHLMQGKAPANFSGAGEEKEGCWLAFEEFKDAYC